MRYASAVTGQLSYAIEDTPYTQKVPCNKYLGYIMEDVDLPGGQNPHTPLNPAGTQRRGPHVWSPDEKEYDVTQPIAVYDHNIPLECALGERTITDVMNLTPVKVADKHTFTEATVLPTMTIEHFNADLDLQEWLIGAKASLGIECSVGEFLKMTLTCKAAKSDYTDSGVLTPLGIPHAKTPFKFIHLGAMTVGAKTMATINSISANWNNDLKANHHGDGRDAYSVSEGGGAEKYDMKFGMNIVDLDLYKRAKDNEAPVNVEIPFIRGLDPDATVIDACYIKMTDAKILEANVSRKQDGVLTGDVVLGPRNTSIEIITPI